MISKEKVFFSLVILGLIALDFALGHSFDFVANAVGKTFERFTMPSPSEPNETYLYGLKPNFSTKTRFGPFTVPFVTNSAGFRDSQVRTVSNRADKFRVLFIGDSFTEGVGVSFEKSFVGRIQAMRPGWEVLNAGVSSYSPAFYYSKIKYFIDKIKYNFDEVVIFIDISDIKDELGRGVTDDHVVVLVQPAAAGYRPRPMAPFFAKPESTISPLAWVKQFLRDHTISVRFLYAVKDVISDAIKGCGPVDVECRVLRAQKQDFDPRNLYDLAMWTQDKRLFDSYGRAGLERAKEHMTRLADFLSSRNIGATVVVYPWPHQIYSHDRDSIQVRFWQDWARRFDVCFINLFPSFFAEGDAEGVIRKYFFPNDVHWNEAGHDLVARLFLRSWTGCRS